MVRFSDILKTRDFHRAGPAPSGGSAKKDNSLELHESQIIKTEDLDGLTDLISTDPAVLKLERHYDQFHAKAKDIRDRVKENRGISHSPVLALLHQILDRELIDALYEYSTLAIENSDLPSHVIAVTLASMKMGQGLGYDTKNLLRLGLAAFLENVGMYRIPEAVLTKKGRLTPEELAVIRNHPETSAQILGQMGSAFAWLSDVALQVHERSDGSGYPKGLKGSEISEYASIIGIIDTYMAMIKNKPHRLKYLQTNAVKNILEESKTKFPPRIVKEFLNQISLFPINTYVRLNNKSIGRIVSTDKAQPLRPFVEILFDGLGHRVEGGKIVNLAESPLLHIVDTMDQSELPA